MPQPITPMDATYLMHQYAALSGYPARQGTEDARDEIWLASVASHLVSQGDTQYKYFAATEPQCRRDRAPKFVLAVPHTSASLTAANTPSRYEHLAGAVEREGCDDLIALYKHQYDSTLFGVAEEERSSFWDDVVFAQGWNPMHTIGPNPVQAPRQACVFGTAVTVPRTAVPARVPRAPDPSAEAARERERERRRASKSAKAAKDKDKDKDKTKDKDKDRARARRDARAKRSAVVIKTEDDGDGEGDMVEVWMVPALLAHVGELHYNDRRDMPAGITFDFYTADNMQLQYEPIRHALPSKGLLGLQAAACRKYDAAERRRVLVFNRALIGTLARRRLLHWRLGRVPAGRPLPREDIRAIATLDRPYEDIAREAELRPSRLAPRPAVLRKAVHTDGPHPPHKTGDQPSHPASHHHHHFIHSPLPGISSLIQGLPEPSVAPAPGYGGAGAGMSPTPSFTPSVSGTSMASVAGSPPPGYPGSPDGTLSVSGQSMTTHAPADDPPAAPSTSTNGSTIANGNTIPGHTTPGHTIPTHLSPVYPDHTIPAHTMPAYPAHTVPAHTVSGYLTASNAVPGDTTSGPAFLTHAVSGYHTASNAVPGNTIPAYAIASNAAPVNTVGSNAFTSSPVPANPAPANPAPGTSAPGNPFTGNASAASPVPANTSAGNSSNAFSANAYPASAIASNAIVNSTIGNLIPANNWIGSVMWAQVHGGDTMTGDTMTGSTMTGSAMTSSAMTSSTTPGNNTATIPSNNTANSAGTVNNSFSYSVLLSSSSNFTPTYYTTVTHSATAPAVTISSFPSSGVAWPVETIGPPIPQPATTVPNTAGSAGNPAS